MKVDDSSNQRAPGKANARRISRARVARSRARRFWSEENPNTIALLHGLSALKQGDFAARLPLDWTGVSGAVAERFDELATASERANQELVQLRKTAGDTRTLLNALTELKSGDFSVRLPLDWVGVAGKTADTFNEVVALNQRMASELVRLRDSVGREGRINQRASLGEVGGTWAESTIDLLVSDIGLPDGEGHDLVRKMRDRGHKSKSIALSGYGTEQDITRSHAAGFQAHLVKPVLPQDLLTTIKRLFGSGPVNQIQ